MIKKDNYWFISQYLTNQKAVFGHVDMDGLRHYIALNRAAKRFLASNKILNLAKANKIQIDLAEGMLL